MDDLFPTRELIGSNPGSGYRRLGRLVRTGELVRVRRGMVARPAERLPDQRLRLEIEAAAPMLHRGTRFSHRSAAALHGLPVVIRSTTRVEVVRTFGGHGGRTSRLHARTAHLLPGEGVFLDGIPATSVERTVIDLVRMLPFPKQ